MEQLLLPLLILMLFGLMVLQMTRQRKQMKQIEQLQQSLQPGDEIVTFHGLHATVAAVTDSTVDLTIAPGVTTTWDRGAIRSRVDGETEPADIKTDDTGQAHEDNRP